MNTPSFEEIKNWAESDFPGSRIGIAHLLSAWAKHDQNKQFEHLLANTGLSTTAIMQLVAPMVKDPLPEDFKIVTQCLLDHQSSKVTGSDLIETICKNPTFRICKILFHGGLDFKQLVCNLNDQHLALQGNDGDIYDTNSDDAFLEKYTRNMNQQAENGQFDDLIELDDEVDKITNIMLRRKKSNVVLTGQPGIGKTVRARLLAKKIVAGQVPETLMDAVILELDTASIVADTMYRGQFEKRFIKILDIVSHLDRLVILFIDEFHMIIGAGSAKNTLTTGANILKPYLTEKNFSVIGATTTDEYHRFVTTDKAFTRRFEHYPVQEPDKALTEQIVDFQANVLSGYHGVKIGTDIIKYAINLTSQHMPNRCQPDKTIDLIDISCASLVAEKQNTLTPEKLLSECALITGRHIEFLNGHNKNRLLNLEAKINAELIGQQESVAKVCDTIIYRRLGTGTEDRPLGVFMLSGKSSVGKTTLPVAMARLFYGTSDALLHLDMAEYNEPGSFSKLVGTAPGYVGYDDTPGVITQWLRRHGSGIILFDEIEKAHPSVCHSLLGLLDNGRITSSGGDTLDAKQCIIIATTNAVTEKELNRCNIGFGHTNNEKPDIKPMLKHHFSNEFLNRFDEILLFNNLGEKELKKIIALRFQEAQTRFLKSNVIFSVDTDQMFQFLLDKLNLAGADARGISKILERELLIPVSKAILSKSGQSATHLEVEIDEDFYSRGCIKIIDSQHGEKTGDEPHVQ